MKTTAPPKIVTDLVELLSWRASVSGEERGFRFLEGGEGEGVLRSFAALDRRARAIGARIQEHVRPGERALLLYPPSLEYIDAFFGCLYAGVIAVPAYPPDPKRLQRTLPRLQAIISDSGAKLALTTSQIAMMARFLGAEAPELNEMTWVATDSIEDEEGQALRREKVSPETVAFLQYTSGSTGDPKGVILDHEAIFRNEELIRRSFQIVDGDVGVHWLPLYHDMGLLGAVIQPVYSGCDSVLMSPLDFLKRPQRWVEAISRFGGTVSSGPNFGYDLAVRKTPPEVRDGLDLSRWKVACNGAEPVRPATLERFAEFFGPSGFRREAFMPAYGLAEVGLIVSATPADKAPESVAVEAKEIVSSGEVLGEFELQIVDPNSGHPVAEGEVGEVWLRGESVARGYWEKPAINEEIFGAHLATGEGPFLRTGDLGAVVAGELAITGRLKELIIIRGVNHYPQDIEITAEGVHEGIRPGCGAAFSVQVGDDEELVLVQEVNPDAVEDLEGLIDQISEAITAAHQVAPKEIVLIEPRTLEKTSSGKIRRVGTKEAYLNGNLAIVARGAGSPAIKMSTAAMGAESARPEIVSWLVDRVAQVAELDREAVDLNRPFSAFGIDSAEAVGIVGELEERLGVELESSALYDFPTISALAVHLSGGERSGTSNKSKNGVKQVRQVGDDLNGLEGALAIVGIGCSFPGASDVEAFWELMTSAKEAVREVPEERRELERNGRSELDWADVMASSRGGYLEDIHEFDGRFFEISPAEMRAMDPQQRLVMTTAWQALQDAGYDREALSGTSTGVFVGQSGSDFARIYDGPPVRAGSGMAPSITANRLSYWLNLRGPSAVVDAACASSLLAMDQALLYLRAGRCDMAIVGGVNAILSLETTAALAQAQMLSAKGQCRPFDEGADGYVRGEGCGIVVVKRLADALRDGDRIRAVIRGGAVNQAGMTNGLTAPSGEAQRAVIEEALQDAGVFADEIGYIEAQGTGTELGDAIEARALREVFGAPNGNPSRWLGSVKAQIGHLEAGAGIAALIKATLMVERGEIVPQVNFERPSPACRLEELPFKIPKERMKWQGRQEGKMPRRAGVSAFGMGGTNAHFVVEEPFREGKGS